MSRARLVITAVVIEGRSQAEVARAYGASKGWVSKLIARYREEGEAAFEARSRELVKLFVYGVGSSQLEVGVDSLGVSEG